MPAYIRRFPPAYTATYVKATSYYSTSYYPWFGLDPLLSLVGASSYTSWLTSSMVVPQKFNVDFGVPVAIHRIYFDNYHTGGKVTNAGVKTLLIYGTNSSTAFDNVDASNTVDLTLIATVSVDIHPPDNVISTQVLDISSSVDTYRYICMIITDVYDYGASYFGFRNITFATTAETVDTETFPDTIFTRVYLQKKNVYEKMVSSTNIVYKLWYNKRIKLTYDVQSDKFITTSMSAPTYGKFIPASSNTVRPTYFYDESSLFTYTEGYIEGFVTVSGIAWPNVVVRLYYNVDGLLISSTKSDDTGYFRFNMLEYNKDYYTVLAYKDGFNAIVYDGVKARRT